MSRIFRDDNYQKLFDENAYVIVDLYTEADLHTLDAIYHQHTVSESNGLQLTIQNDKIEVNKKIYDLTRPIAQAAVAKVLMDYDILYAGFIAKLPGKPNISGVHRDPTLVDESQHKTLLVWAPLIDVHDQNGTLGIIPHSVDLFPGFKSLGRGKYDFSIDEDQKIKRFGQLLSVKRGQAVILDTALLHFSPQNETDETRVVHSCFAIPATAAPISYHHNAQRNTWDVYKIDSDFMISYYTHYIQMGDLSYPLLSRTEYVTPVRLSLDDFAAKLGDGADYATDDVSSLPPAGGLIEKFRHWITGAFSWL